MADSREAAMALLREDARKFQMLSGWLQLHLWVFKKELLAFVQNNQDEKSQRLVNSFNEVVSRAESILDFYVANINQREQKFLMDSVEVVGLPEEYSMDLEGVVTFLSSVLRIYIESSYIRGFERVGLIGPHGRPRTLIIRFIDTNIRKRVLHVANFGVLILPGSERPVYISEHLTHMNHELLRKARARALRLRIDNVWVEEGRIFFKKNHRAQIHEIRCESDIQMMHLY